MAEADPGGLREIPVEVDPRFGLARIQLQRDRPKDWLEVLNLVVEGLEK